MSLYWRHFCCFSSWGSFNLNRDEVDLEFVKFTTMRLPCIASNLSLTMCYRLGKFKVRLCDIDFLRSVAILAARAHGRTKNALFHIPYPHTMSAVDREWSILAEHRLFSQLITWYRWIFQADYFQSVILMNVYFQVIHEAHPDAVLRKPESQNPVEWPV